MEDSLLFDAIGWFTTFLPIDIDGWPRRSLFDVIRRVKDIHKRVPGKGRQYFACRFDSDRGKTAFESHKHVELIFNYRGSFQQLEDPKSIFKLEDRPERNVAIPGNGPDYQRPSLIDTNLVIREGLLQIHTKYHKHMRGQANVRRWLDLYANTLSTAALV
jgi:non-ribosomal peptide synthase protein (TIGR01720 family)